MHKCQRAQRTQVARRIARTQPIEVLEIGLKMTMVWWSAMKQEKYATVRLAEREAWKTINDIQSASMQRLGSKPVLATRNIYGAQRVSATSLISARQR